MATSLESLQRMNKFEFVDNELCIRLAVDLLRRVYHEEKGEQNLHRRDRKRIIKRACQEVFDVDGDDDSWQYKEMRKLYKKQEKSEFGGKNRIFSGLVADKSAGRTTRTDFTANMTLEESAKIAPELKAMEVSGSVKAAFMGIGEGGSMREKLEAKRKMMLSWDDFKKDNLDHLDSMAETKMLQYRKELDEERNSKLAKGRNHGKGGDDEKKSKKRRKKGEKGGGKGEDEFRLSNFFDDEGGADAAANSIKTSF